jgi:DNA-binding protein HU-beta
LREVGLNGVEDTAHGAPVSSGALDPRYEVDEMTKSDLVQQVAKDTGLSQNQTSKIINEIFDAISESLQKGEDVRITGFGTFRTAETKERSGRNPRTGEEITIPAGKRVSFTAGSGLLESVRGESSGKKQVA